MEFKLYKLYDFVFKGIYNLVKDGYNMSLLKINAVGVAEKAPTLMTVSVTLMSKSKTANESLAGLTENIQWYLLSIANNIGISFVKTTQEERKNLSEVFEKSVRECNKDILATYFTSGVSTRQAYSRDNSKGLQKKDGFISSQVYNFIMEINTSILAQLLELNTENPERVSNTTYGFTISDSEKHNLNVEARKMAFESAEDRAELYRSLLGGKTVFLSVLSEMPSAPNFSYRTETAVFGARKGMSAQQQEILAENITIENIVETVTLYCEYEVTGN